MKLFLNFVSKCYMNTSIDKIRKDIGLLYFTAICVHVRVSENLENMDLKKKRRSAPGPLEGFCIVTFKNSVSFYFVKKIRKLPSILYDNCL